MLIMSNWASSSAARRKAEMTDHGRPGLIDHVQADRPAELIDVRVKDLIHEADRGRFVRIRVGQLDVHLPDAAKEGR